MVPMFTLILLSAFFIFAGSPFLVAVLLMLVLLTAAMTAATLDSFLGLVIFIVYVGGAMVLFSYCFMLTPLQQTGKSIPLYLLPVAMLGGWQGVDTVGSLYEFYWVSSLLLLVGVLLLVVMLSVVEIIDFHSGSMRVE